MPEVLQPLMLKFGLTAIAQVLQLIYPFVYLRVVLFDFNFYKF